MDADQHIRLECLKLAGGDLIKARIILDSVMTASPIRAIPRVSPFVEGTIKAKGDNWAG